MYTSIKTRMIFDNELQEQKLNYSSIFNGNKLIIYKCNKLYLFNVGVLYSRVLPVGKESKKLLARKLIYLF